MNISASDLTIMLRLCDLNDIIFISVILHIIPFCLGPGEILNLIPTRVVYVSAACIQGAS